jgi:hypothetical protein
MIRIAISQAAFVAIAALFGGANCEAARNGGSE